MLEQVYFYFLCILDILFLYMGFSWVFKEKRINNVLGIITSILFFAYLDYLITDVWVMNEWVCEVCCNLVFYVFVNLIFKLKPLLSFVYFLITVIGVNLIGIVVGLSLDVIEKDFVVNGLIVVIAVHSLKLIMYYTLSKIWNKKLIGLNQDSLLILAKTLIIPSLILSFLFELYFVKEDSFWFLVSILLYVVSLIILFNNTTKLIILSEKEAKTKMLEFALKQSEEQINNLNDYYKEMRKIKHDMKNNLLIMDSLMTQEKYEEVSNYMKKLIEKLEVTSKVYKTGNIYLDAVLNSKATENSDIKIDYKGTVEGKTFISEMDLCTLLFNLLDNAIHELREHEELKKEIYLDVSQEETQMIINVSNPLSKKKDIEKGSTLNHGLGLVIVREIVDKYDGYLYIKQDEEFSVTIQLFGD